ncbi:MAG: TIGR03905 family TSCPD domain-containing protein [Bacilli bacterium]|jgi:uncharacterized protein (TIGR03905 family)
MVDEIVFKPQNVCSREMRITIENGIIIDASIIGGCQGNTAGICSLIKGMKIQDVVNKLSKIKCRGSKNGLTSCPDQLSKALISR